MFGVRENRCSVRQTNVCSLKQMFEVSYYVNWGYVNRTNVCSPKRMFVCQKGCS